MSKIKIPSIYCIIALLYFFTAPMLKATQVYKETNNHDDAFSDLSDSENEESKGTAYEEPERILPTLDSIQNHIQQFQKDGNQKKQGALLIGRSGAGKTSLINLLAGKPLRSEEDDIEGYVLANTSPEQPQIGDNVKSETSSPSPYPSQDVKAVSVTNTNLVEDRTWAISIYKQIR